MQVARIPVEEPGRLHALHNYEILDTPPEKAFDDIVAIAAGICDTPIAVVSLVDAARQWFKAKVGIGACETSREVAFCAHGILQKDLFIVRDALEDERFRDNPLVTGEPGVRFYAGATLISPDGYALGMLCVVDHVPRDLTADQKEMLRRLARAVVSELELRRTARLLQENEEKYRDLLDNADEYVVILSPEGRIIYVNNVTFRVFGYTEEETSKLSLWDLVAPGSRRDCEEAFERVLAGERVEPFEASFFTKDGKKIVTVGRPFAWKKKGELVDVRGIFRDVTEHRRVQEALARSEEDRARLEEQSRQRDSFQRLVGKSAVMQEVYRRIRLAAQSDVTVLITGESGTGKELAAEAIHALSSRRDKPFLTVNCAAIPETLLESELFGHVKGAFTGAMRDRDGVFKSAQSGTLFLDEIAEMATSVQTKVLRVLQEREFRRVGDDRPLKVDVRVVTATNRDLVELLRSGDLREDLYYRINVFRIDMPPLRDRREDVPLLAERFVRERAVQSGRAVPDLDPEVLKCMLDYPWPGNVRELHNALEHALVTLSGSKIMRQNLPAEVRELRPVVSRGQVLNQEDQEERERIMEALTRSGGRRTEAAKELGISRVTLWKRIRRLGIRV